MQQLENYKQDLALTFLEKWKHIYGINSFWKTGIHIFQIVAIL